MVSRTTVRVAAAAVVLFGARTAAAQAPPPVVQAPLYYSQQCAQCHDKPDESHAPSREALQQRTPEFILAAMTTGRMTAQASALTDSQRLALAIFLSGRAPGASGGGDASSMSNRCASKPLGNPLGGPTWNGWGGDPGNTRFQPARTARLTPDLVPKLTLKWAFGFPYAASAFGQPTVVGGRVYAGSDSAYVYSVDAASGCVYWSFAARAGIRNAISVGPLKGSSRFAVYFGDIQANVYAVDAESGRLLWTKSADPHPFARITGTPALFDGRLYVPVSSLEEMPGGDPKYSCCTFRGSLVAYDATTGEQLWKSYAIRDAPKPTKRTTVGTQLYGPSGAAIWSAPTIDTKRGVVYVSTGDAYSLPADEGTDAIVAFDLKSGVRRWVRQLTPNDVWLVGCTPNPTGRSETCPDALGPDVDFGSSVILATLRDGRNIMVVAQKSGVIWALDPDRRGEIIWQQRVAQGGAGGIQFGQAVDDVVGYFPSPDGRPRDDGAGLTALKLASGEMVWRTVPPCSDAVKPCSRAHSAAISLIAGVVFAGTSDGVMRAYSTTDGRVLWEYSTAKSYTTVNGVAAKGGALSGPGPTIANGMLFMNSGYSAIGGNGAGNVLLAFGVE
jgi:polyvinyl alcohol dehydrogenase (cytochrome)